MTTYRKATLNDLPAIQKLNDDLFDLEIENFDDQLIKNWPLAEEGKKFLQNCIENEFVGVAVSASGEVVGSLCGTLLENPINRLKLAELKFLSILPGNQKKGIGGELFERFKQWCKEKEIEGIKVTASYKNKNAIAFYERNNFFPHELILHFDLQK